MRAAVLLCVDSWCCVYVYAATCCYGAPLFVCCCVLTKVAMYALTPARGRLCPACTPPRAAVMRARSLLWGVCLCCVCVPPARSPVLAVASAAVCAGVAAAYFFARAAYSLQRINVVPCCVCDMFLAAITRTAVPLCAGSCCCICVVPRLARRLRRVLSAAVRAAGVAARVGCARYQRLCCLLHCLCGVCCTYISSLMKHSTDDYGLCGLLTTCFVCI